MTEVRGSLWNALNDRMCILFTTNVIIWGLPAMGTRGAAIATVAFNIGAKYAALSLAEFLL